MPREVRLHHLKLPLARPRLPHLVLLVKHCLQLSLLLFLNRETGLDHFFFGSALSDIVEAARLPIIIQLLRAFRNLHTLQHIPFEIGEVVGLFLIDLFLQVGCALVDAPIVTPGRLFLLLDSVLLSLLHPVLVRFQLVFNLDDVEVLGRPTPRHRQIALVLVVLAQVH